MDAVSKPTTVNTAPIAHPQLSFILLVMRRHGGPEKIIHGSLVNRIVKDRLPLLQLILRTRMDEGADPFGS